MLFIDNKMSAFCTIYWHKDSLPFTETEVNSEKDKSWFQEMHKLVDYHVHVNHAMNGATSF